MHLSGRKCSPKLSFIKLFLSSKFEPYSMEMGRIEVCRQYHLVLLRHFGIPRHILIYSRRLPSVKESTRVCLLPGDYVGLWFFYSDFCLSAVQHHHDFFSIFDPLFGISCQMVEIPDGSCWEVMSRFEVGVHAFTGETNQTYDSQMENTQFWVSSMNEPTNSIYQQQHCKHASWSMKGSKDH